MTTFQDGPAKGARLMLKRTPFFLRVTQEDDKFDALDQPGDNPRPMEKVHVYEWAEKPVGMMHIRASRGSGFYGIAIYKLSQEQPPEAVVRDNDKWNSWCMSNVEGKRRYEFFMSIK